MPYRSTSDLPQPVIKHLPAHAQEIYMQAFNNAWSQYADKRKRRENISREATAHKVAWGAVERQYEKDSNDKWRKKIRQ